VFGTVTLGSISCFLTDLDPTDSNVGLDGIADDEIADDEIANDAVVEAGFTWLHPSRLVMWRRGRMVSEQGDGVVQRRPRVESAAAAGIVYSLLTTVALVIINRIPSPSSTELEWTEWIEVAGNRRLLYLCLNLASISSVAFLWFVAVVRRRVGEREDRFFATVFLGSALVYVGLWLVATSMLAAPAVLYGLADGRPLDWEVYRLAEGTAAGILLVAGPRISAVFVASTSTVFLRTGVVPNWLAYVGYGVALIMFFAPIVTTPLGLGLPLFVLVASSTILVSRALSDEGGSSV
jgi:hypothetical protein